MAEFRVQIYSQEKKELDEQVTSIIVHGVEGYLGVLAHHAPLVALLEAGRFWMRRAGGGEDTYHTGGGFIEVRDNVATLLVDHFRL